MRLFLEAYFRGVIELNKLRVTFSDDVAGLYQIGDGSNIIDLPIEARYLARPMAILRLSRMYASENFDFPLFIKSHNPHMIANGVELLPECLTQAVVHIVRDPRDVLPSFSKHMGTDLDTGLEWMQDDYRHLSNNKNRVGELITSWGKHTQSFINADTHNVKTFLFEDLKSDPINQFAAILDHSGIDPDINRVKQAVASVEIGKMREKEQKEGFCESSPHAKNQFFGAGAVGGWKGKLTPMQSHRIEKNFGRIMKRLGYLKQRVA